MININTDIKFNDELPEEVDVVVIGGGIIGVFSALNMVRKGLKVIVLEKGRIAAEQSSRNWGWIRQQGRDPAELPIMMEASRQWEEIDKQVKGRTGFKRQGVLYLAQTEAAQERREAWIVNAKEHDLPCDVISQADVSKFIDESVSAKGFWKGAVFTPTDAKAEPWQAIPAVTELAQSEGALIKENCAVRALDIQAGQINAVITEAGRIKTSQVVLAGGAWSSLFLRRHGINVPQLSIRASVARTAPLGEIAMHNCGDQGLAFRHRADGGYTLALTDFEEHFVGRDSFRCFPKWITSAWRERKYIKLSLNQLEHAPDAWHTPRQWAENEISPFEKMRVLDPAPTAGKIKLMQQRFAERFPQIGQPELLNTWAGMIDAMPDLVPIVDRVPSLEGLIVATGMSGHGFGIGPAYGKIIAQMACAESSEYDLDRFRFSRFTDGSRLVIGPSI